MLLWGVNNPPRSMGPTPEQEKKIEKQIPLLRSRHRDSPYSPTHHMNYGASLAGMVRFPNLPQEHQYQSAVTDRRSICMVALVFGGILFNAGRVGEAPGRSIRQSLNTEANLESLGQARGYREFQNTEKRTAAPSQISARRSYLNPIDGMRIIRIVIYTVNSGRTARRRFRGISDRATRQLILGRINWGKAVVVKIYCLKKTSEEIEIPGTLVCSSFRPPAFVALGEQVSPRSLATHGERRVPIRRSV